MARVPVPDPAADPDPDAGPLTDRDLARALEEEDEAEERRMLIIEFADAVREDARLGTKMTGTLPPALRGQVASAPGAHPPK